MVSSAKVLGVLSSSSQRSKEEADLLQCSIHKIRSKDGDLGSKIMANDQATQVAEKAAESSTSYKDKLLNLFGEDVHQELIKSIMEENKALSSQEVSPQAVEAGIEIPLSDDF